MDEIYGGTASAAFGNERSGDEKMINYELFNTTNNHAYNLYHAIQYCQEHGENGLIFQKGTYDFYSDMASEDVLCVSNHTIYGISRIAFLLKNLENFCVDGNGSCFVFHGGIVPFVIRDSKDITIQNLSIDYDGTRYLHGIVLDVNQEYFDLRIMEDAMYRVVGNKLLLADSDGNEDPCRWMMIRSIGEDTSFIPEACDCYGDRMHFEDLGENRIRVRNCDLTVKEGIHLGLGCTSREAANIVITESKDVNINHVWMYRSHGMGVLAQKSENISIDQMVVQAKEGRLFSLNGDATHFVNCRGEVRVTNCRFSEQLDDALNVHGIFTQIVDKTDEYILVRYMHPDAKGINLFDSESKFVVVDALSVLPKGVYEIEKVEIINLNYTKLYVAGGTETIQTGDLVEDLKGVCDLVFENNIVRNNRARGILIAAKGKVRIRNNYFNTPGVAILFESDAQAWFESGSTTDVSITENTFENCMYTKGNWGHYVIEMSPRPDIVEKRYYHDHIRIERNSFRDNKGGLLYADNVKCITFVENKLVNCSSSTLTKFTHCSEAICDIEE